MISYINLLQIRFDSLLIKKNTSLLGCFYLVLGYVKIQIKEFSTHSFINSFYQNKITLQSLGAFRGLYI